ncbi:FG-GAP-like repeat-containing protein [Streptomyces sp. NBC_00280]|uniref:FG-GAP-like repeat-containing protein n=1 Tax=Streptomyces sp. NBC_00280 TaxID=2975699 RepID=UPI003243A17F
MAATLSLGLPLGAIPAASAVPAAPSAVAAAGELVLPAAQRAVPRSTWILNAGASGFLWVQEGDDRLLWTDYATGATSGLEQRLPFTIHRTDIGSGSYNDLPVSSPGWYGDGSDTVALYSDQDDQVTLIQGDGTSGSTAVVPVAPYHSYLGTFGGTVLTISNNPRTYHLLRPQDGGGVTDTPMTGLPEGAGGIDVQDGDATSVLVQYESGADGQDHWGTVDLATGVYSALPDRVDASDEGREVTGFQLGTDSVVRLRAGSGKADVFDRDDLSAPPRTLDTGSLTTDASFGVVGDALLGIESQWTADYEYVPRGRPLWALTSDGTGTDTTKVMDPATSQLVQAPDGSVLVAGAERYVAQGDLDWNVYRIAPAADGTVARTRMTAVQPVAAQIHGLSLGSGILSTADNSTLYEPDRAIGAYRSTWLTTPVEGGTPSVTRSTVDGLVDGWDGNCGVNDNTPRCIPMFADGTGHHGRERDTLTGLTMLYANGSPNWGPTIDTNDDSPELTDLSGRYAIVEGVSSSNQYIGEFSAGAAGKILQKRKRVAAAVWGNTLWSGAATGGKVTATRLPSGTAVESFTTTNGCAPYELQAVGRWVYWQCLDEPEGNFKDAGVYDRTTKRTSTAPVGGVLLGDGYLVQYIEGTYSESGLTLVDLHGGLPSSGSYDDLPNRKLVDWRQLGRYEDGTRSRRTTWTVDRFGGPVAYADDEQRVHIVPTGVPASALTAIDSTVTSNSASWSGSWWLSKPAAGWQVTVRDKASGATVRTLTGSAAHGLLKAAWDGKDTAERLVANGTYTWTLTAKPADGQGAALTLAGTTKVTTGSAAPRDYAGSDGVGDILTLSANGTLTVQRGTGTGTLGAKVTGAGWPTTAKFVPYGDLSGDRCNDVLVRTGDGTLRAYRPACGKAATPSTPYTALGTGWNQYDVLTSPGDVDGDRRPDLVARQASTGDAFLFKGTSTGKLSARTKVGSRWTGYKKIVGAGDLNGDGRGDLVAQDGSNVLWRFDGTGTGAFSARVKIAANWGASYNAVVGVGDFTGDGRADLVSRDTAGNVWRTNGNGKGVFGARTRIATGWQGYKSVM